MSFSPDGSTGPSDSLATVDLANRDLAFTVYQNATNTVPYRSGGKPWEQLRRMFQKRQVRDAKNGPGFSLVALKPGTVRRGKNVAVVSALVFDIDGKPLDAIRGNLNGYEWLAYSTHSHTTDEHCYRLIFPLKRDVTPAEFARLWKGINSMLLNSSADAQCRDIGRFYYLPSSPTATVSNAFAIHNEGEWLDPDRAVATAPATQSPSSTDDVFDQSRSYFDDLSLARKRQICDALRYLAGVTVNDDKLWIDRYGNWLNLGMAIHHASRKKHRGLQLYQLLSKKSSTWQADPKVAAAECDEKWQSFGNYSGRPITLRSLLREARTLGYVRLAEPANANYRFHLKTIHEVLHQRPPRWLVRGLLQEQKLTVIYGSANTGKSFLALDIGQAVARGIDWFGRKTTGGLVVYLAIEGTQRNRVAAYLKHHNLSAPPADFRIVDVPLNLRDRSGSGGNKRETSTDAELLVDEIRAQLGNVPIRAIVIDTLNQAMQGGDENSSVDMGAFIANANAIRAALGCAVIVIHHAGKDRSLGARGHSSLNAAVDTEIEVTQDRGTGIRTATVSKQRDGPVDQEIHFLLHRVDIGPDPDEPNEQITSCVITPLPLTMNVPARGRAAPKGRNQKAVWNAVRTLGKMPQATVVDGVPRIPEDAFVDAVVATLAKPSGRRDQRRQKAGEAIEGMRKGAWIDVTEADGRRYIVPGPRAAGHLTVQPSLQEMPEMPEFA